MASRMDKYNSELAQPISRSKKNEKLYQQLYDNKTFTEFSEVENDNVIDLSNVSSEYSMNKRQIFHKNKAFNSVNNSKMNFSPRNINDIGHEEMPMEKNYNINDILDEARKNRVTVDELEKKRHLKAVEYNILSDLSQEKLKEYRESKQKLTKAEEEDLEELIHTITSNSLRKRIDDELLGDLLPSEESETIISKQLLDELDEANTLDNITVSEDTDELEIDDSFYTKSMDLSEEDFDVEYEEEEEDRSFLEDANMDISKKVLLVLFILIILGIIWFVIYYFI